MVIGCHNRRIKRKLLAIWHLFLAERTPKYIDFDHEKKKKVQNILFYLKPVDVYSPYIEWEKTK